jgi:RimJ/RimL family protein N-acetyltransferase
VRRAFLVGDKLYLRPLEAGDVSDEYLDWLHDAEVTRYLETGRFPTSREALAQYVERASAPPDNLVFAIVDRQSELHVGNVALNRIHWIHGTTDTGLMLGRKEFWGRGYAFEAWSLAIEYAFERLNLRKIVAGVVADNRASVAVLRKLGFQLEGTLRSDLFVDGSYRDNLRFGMFRHEFYKWAK